MELECLSQFNKRGIKMIQINSKPFFFLKKKSDILLYIKKLYYYK
jgi:prephenate dehydratase